MDQIRQFLRIAWRRWETLSPRQQRLARLAMMAVGLLIASWGVLQATPQYAWLLSGREFSVRELTALEAALGKAGLNEYFVENGRVRVPQDQRATYIGALAEGNALPIQFDLELKDELRRSSPFESQEQRRARLQMTEQRELALILRGMKGIEDATVHLDQSTTGPFQRDRRMTAMVVVRPRDAQPLDIAMIRSIRHLVAASKVDLTPEDVTVTDLETGMSFAGDLGDPALIRSDELAMRRMSYQRDCRGKLERLLAFIPGVQIAVNVELEYRSFPQDSITEGGGPTPPTQVLVPAAVGVAIGIPEGFYQNAWREQQRGLARNERKKLTPEVLADLREAQNERVRRLVQNALPAETVVAINAFGDSSTWLSATDSWRLWPLLKSSWPSVVLGLSSLFVLSLLGWNIVEAQQATAAVSGSVDDTTTVSAVAYSEEGSPVQDASANDDYHHELTRMVRQDPDAAAAKLAEWIDRAA